MGAARTGILSNATLLFVPFLSLLALPREPVRLWVWAATAVAALGVAFLAGPWAIDWSWPDAFAGHVLLLAAALAWAATLVGLRRWPPAAPTLELLPWAALLSALLLAAPLVGALFAHLWLGEPIGWVSALGGTFIGIAVALAARRRPAQHCATSP